MFRHWLGRVASGVHSFGILFVTCRIFTILDRDSMWLKMMMRYGMDEDEDDDDDDDQLLSNLILSARVCVDCVRVLSL